MVSLSMKIASRPTLVVSLMLFNPVIALPLWGLLQNHAQNPLLNSVISPASSSVSLISQDLYEGWLADEAEISFQHVLDNVGGYGPIGDTVARGQVVASPSKNEPDYYYIWTRDAALTMNSVVTRYNDGRAQNETLKCIIEDYIKTSYDIQRTDNPSGTFDSGDALGEPKFEVDGTPFTGNWGRPQRDGPALRAITIMNYIRSQLRFNESAAAEHFSQVYHDIVKTDLRYVVKHWRSPGFDLWEEIRGKHFFTSTVQLRSLVAAAKLAPLFGDDQADTYANEASLLRKFMTQYATFSGRITETVDGDSTANARNGLDAAIFLGAQYSLDLQEWDGEAQSDIPYAPYSNELIATLVSFVDDMSVRYPINSRRFQAFASAGANLATVGVSVGRYPEDVYNGAGTSLGNPWFLCTAAVAENLYILADYLNTRPNDYVLELTDSTAAFFAKFGIFSSPVSKQENPQLFHVLTQSIVDYADSFLDVIREHQSSDGRMSEQFSRYDGIMKGAENLTWSYGAFWGAVRQRSVTKSRMI